MKTERIRTHSRSQTIDSLSIATQSAYYYLRYFKPLAKKNPPLHIGKVEAVAMTSAFNTMGIKESHFKQKNFPEIMTAFIAFTDICKIYDQVVDDWQDNAGKIDESTLDNTPIRYKYFDREVTGKEILDIIEVSIDKAFPGDDPRSGKIKELVLSYRKRVADNANDPKYFGNENVLDYDLALSSKIEVSQFLGEVAAKIFSTAFNIEDPVGVQLYGRICLAVQFGDDLIDWAIDNQRYTGKPKENLFLATLKEFPDEEKECEKYQYDDMSSAEIIHTYAPKTLVEYKRRISLILENLPNHRYTAHSRNTVEFALNILEPRFKNKGKIAAWADIQ